jgi:hypothetical protein
VRFGITEVDCYRLFLWSPLVLVVFVFEAESTSGQLAGAGGFSVVQLLAVMLCLCASGLLQVACNDS